MKSDAQLKKDVESELAWDPSIEATHVGVAVRDGVVTVSGHIATYAEKYAIEKAVQRVAGVRAIAVELDVKLSPVHHRSDTDIAAAAEMALQWHALIPAERVRVTVERGWVTLSGEVDWEYQRRAAEKAVRPLTGVVGVTSGITLQRRVAPEDISERIRDALTRQAAREAKDIEVAVSHGKATIRGKVHSWAERSAVFGAAWSAPGVIDVVNEVQVGL